MQIAKNDMYDQIKKKVGTISRKKVKGFIEMGGQKVTILGRTEATKKKDCINIWMETDQSAHCMCFISSVNVFHWCDFYFACLNSYLNA